MAEKTNQSKLDDLHWNLISEEGRAIFAERIATAAAKVLLDEPIDKPGGGTTTLRTVLGWTALDFAAVQTNIQKAAQSNG